jgi:hypothetical protein
MNPTSPLDSQVAPDGGGKGVFARILAQLKEINGGDGEFGIEVKTQLASSKITGDSILHVLQDLYRFFTDGDMQAVEDRKEMLAALKGQNKPSKKDGFNYENEKNSNISQPSGWMKALMWLTGGAVVAFFTGVILGFVSQLGKEIATLGRALKLGKGGLIGKTIAKIKGWFNGESAIGRFFVWLSDSLGSIGKSIGTKLRGFSGTGTKIGAVIDWFKDLGQMIGNLGRWFSGGKKRFILVRGFERILAIFPIIGKFLSSMMKFGSLFGRILGKLFLPLAAVITLWETVTDAMAGYKKDGIAGMLKGGVIGFVNSTVGFIFDMLKSLTSWLSEKLGFTEFSKWLDGFNFKELFTKAWNWVEGTVSQICEWLGEKSVTGFDWKSIYDNIWNFVSSTINRMLGISEVEQPKKLIPRPSPSSPGAGPNSSFGVEPEKNWWERGKEIVGDALGISSTTPTVAGEFITPRSSIDRYSGGEALKTHSTRQSGGDIINNTNIGPTTNVYAQNSSVTGVGTGSGMPAIAYYG